MAFAIRKPRREGAQESATGNVLCNNNYGNCLQFGFSSDRHSDADHGRVSSISALMVARRALGKLLLVLAFLPGGLQA